MQMLKKRASYHFDVLLGRAFGPTTFSWPGVLPPIMQRIQDKVPLTFITKAFNVTVLQGLCLPLWNLRGIYALSLQT